VVGAERRRAAGLSGKADTHHRAHRSGRATGDRRAGVKRAHIPYKGTPDEFAAYLRAEISKWAKAAQLAGVEPQ
jgi:hypothetical protein